MADLLTHSPSFILHTSKYMALFFCHQKAINFDMRVDSRVNNFLRCEKKKKMREVCSRMAYFCVLALLFHFFVSFRFFSFHFNPHAKPLKPLRMCFHSLHRRRFFSRPYGLFFSQLTTRFSHHAILHSNNKQNAIFIEYLQLHRRAIERERRPNRKIVTSLSILERVCV